MKRSIDEPSGYLERLKPLYVRLFRVAHAIVGNLELSEYVLRSAIVEAYLRRGEWQGRMGFQESLMHTVRTVALVELKGIRAAGSYETDWTFPEPGGLKPSEEMLYTRLMKEGDGMARIVLLHYGADLTVRQIAMVTQLRASDVAAKLRRMESRLSRVLGAKGRNNAQTLSVHIEVLCRAALNMPGEDVAEMGAVFRSFERDVDGAKKPRASAWRIVGIVLKVLGALTLALAVWLMAVLFEPATSQPLPATSQPLPATSQQLPATNQQLPVQNEQTNRTTEL